MDRKSDQVKMKPRGQRSARVLVWTVGFFFIGQVVGGLLLERVWPQLRFPFFYRQLAYLDVESKPPNVMFFGSSRFGSCVSRDHITAWMHELTGDETVHAFNAAVPAGDLVVSEKMLNQVLKRGIKPRVAVIEMCPEVVNHRNDWVRIHLQRQFGWEDLPTYFGEIARTGSLPRLLTSRVLPLYQQRNSVCQELAQGLDQRLEEWLGSGEAGEKASASSGPGVDWQQLVLSNPKVIKEECARNTMIGVGDVPRTLRKYNAGGNAGTALERILQTCKANGITPILVGVPLTKVHRDLYVRPIEENYQAYLREITAKYGCRYVEYRHRVADALFLDNHHADHPGCLTFSRMFTEEVLAPWWKEQGGGNK